MNYKVNRKGQEIFSSGNPLNDNLKKKILSTMRMNQNTLPNVLLI